MRRSRRRRRGARAPKVHRTVVITTVRTSQSTPRFEKPSLRRLLRSLQLERTPSSCKGRRTRAGFHFQPENMIAHRKTAVIGCRSSSSRPITKVHRLGVEDQPVERCFPENAARAALPPAKVARPSILQLTPGQRASQVQEHLRLDLRIAPGYPGGYICHAQWD